MPAVPILPDEPAIRHPCEGCKHFVDGEYGKSVDCAFCKRNPRKPNNTYRAKEANNA